MLSVSLPEIAIERVSNGYVVQWQKRNPDKNTSLRTIHASAVCYSHAELLELIDVAAKDIDIIRGEYE